MKIKQSNQENKERQEKGENKGDTTRTIYFESGIIIMGWYSQQSDKGPHLVKDHA